MIKIFFKWFAVIVVVLTGCTYLFIYIWFHSNADQALTQNQQQWLITKISTSPKLPDKVYKTLEKYYPEFYSENTWNYNLKKIIVRPKTSCQCNDIYLPYIPGDTIERTVDRPWVPFNQYDLLIKLFIEKKFTQKECFTFNMNVSEFGGNAEGMFEASKYYFKKELDKLTEREIIGLYVIQFAPSRYSPLFHQEQYDKAVDEIMK